jgi:hypothetical protein
VLLLVSLLPLESEHTVSHGQVTKQFMLLFVLISQILITIAFTHAGLVLSFILAIYVLQSSQEKLTRYNAGTFNLFMGL